MARKTSRSTSNPTRLKPAICQKFISTLFAFLDPCVKTPVFVFYNIMSDPGSLLFWQSCHSANRMHSVLVCRLAQSHASPDGSQRRGSPPVPLAEQTHGGRDEQHTYQGRVDNHRDGKADADFLKKDDFRTAKGSQHYRQQQRCAGDEPTGTLQARRDGGAIVSQFVKALFDAAQQEDLVVHRQAKRDGEDQHGLRGVDAAAGLEVQQVLQVPILEDPDQPAKGG